MSDYFDAYEHMDGELPEEVVDRETAERVSRWVSREMRKSAVECGPIEAEIARLQELLAERRQIAANKTEDLLRTLESWHRANPGAAKTERFPYGTSTLRARPVKVEADVEFIEWARSNAPHFVHVTVKVDDKAVRDACAGSIKSGEYVSVTDDGELLPGVVLDRPDPSWSFKPAEPLAIAEEFAA